MGQFDKLNTEVAAWSKETASMMRAKVSALSNSSKHDYIKYKQTLAASIKFKTQQNFGVVERVTFPFNKYGFFLATGASRGHSAKSNPRKKVEWYNFVFEQHFEKLADIVAENYAGGTINAMASLLDKKELI